MSRVDFMDANMLEFRGIQACNALPGAQIGHA